MAMTLSSSLPNAAQGAEVEEVLLRRTVGLPHSQDQDRLPFRPSQQFHRHLTAGNQMSGATGQIGDVVVDFQPH